MLYLWTVSLGVEPDGASNLIFPVITSMFKVSPFNNVFTMSEVISNLEGKAGCNTIAVTLLLCIVDSTEDSLCQLRSPS